MRQLTSLIPALVLINLHVLLVDSSRATAASSFPGVRPSNPSRARSDYYAGNNDWWQDGGADGGASSDDEAEDDEDIEESSDDEEWNRLAALASTNAPPDSRRTSHSRRAGNSNHRHNNNNAVMVSSSSSGNGGGAGDSRSQPSPGNYAGNRNPTAAEQQPSSSSQTEPSSTSKERQQSGAQHLQNNTTDSASSPSASQPMETLNKLQQMLDDTDYMTSNSDRSSGPTRNNRKHQQREVQHTPEKLWTSKDRSKYKRVQNRMTDRPPPPPSFEKGALENPHRPSGSNHQSEEPQQQQLWKQQHHQPQEPQRPTTEHEHIRPSPPIQFSSDDDNSEEEMEDGLGYTLPNLPVYYSDGEESEDALSDDEKPTSNNRSQENQNSIIQAQDQSAAQSGGPYSPPLHQANYYGYPQQQQQMPPPQQYGGMPQPYTYAHPQQMYGYQYPYPPPYMTPQQYAYYNQYGAWNGYPAAQQQQQLPPSRSNNLQLPPKPSLSSHTPTHTSATRPNGGIAGEATSTHNSRAHPSAATSSSRPPNEAAAVAITPPPGRLYVPGYTPVTIFVPPESLQDVSQAISFDSFQKLGLLLVTVTLACYSGVSPRSLPLSEYNLRFYENLGLIALTTLAPIFQCILIITPSQNDINTFINTFFTSFTVGYVWAFLSEVVATTAMRLIIFSWFEPKIFSLAPKIPIPVIPWVLRESGYRPKRITLLAAEIAVSCVVCPLIEEYIKLCVLRWTTPLKRNFNWTKKTISSASSSSRKKKTRTAWVAEPIIRPPNEPDIINANQYISQMLAASLGFKLADAGRRILLFTKRSDPSKGLYAFCRGLFPIHELTGTMTALGLAKKNLLGVKIPTWKLLLPAVVIHGMANFRGKKPVYRWGSATPWSEMQLPAFHIPDSSSLPKLLTKGFAKIMWFIIITRVIGYCVKNYYMVNRQAVKRTTTYAGKPAAFSAKLTTSEMLKKK